MMYPLLFSWMLFASGWQAHGTADGVAVETRPAKGSQYDWFRVAADSHLPADVLAEAIWGPAGKEGVVSTYVQEHRVIEDTPQERLVYERVAAPMVSERDYVMRTSRAHNDGQHVFVFETVDDERMPPQNGKVRMRIEGHCSVEPTASGGSRITYEIFSDLGGDLPAWMAKSAQRDATVQWLKTMLSRGEQRWLLTRGTRTASN